LSGSHKRNACMEFLSRLHRRDAGSPGPGLDIRIACFREVLHANNAALGFIAEMQEALESTGRLTAAQVSRMITGATVQAFRMVTHLMRMTGMTGRKEHRELVRRFNDLKNEIAGKVEAPPALKPVGLAVRLADVGPELAEAVGMKSAYLGEARRILRGHVPDGFATTVEAFRVFMDNERLGERIAVLLEGLNAKDVGARFEASAQIVQMVERWPVAGRVAGAIQSAVAAIPGSPYIRLAVRSSALQESGHEMSFAGQYRSMLNIRPDGVVDAFRRVIASKYSPEALTYWLERGFSDPEVAMCCCIVKMVNAAAAGVLYTSFPTPAGVKTVLQAVRGLGLTAVDGSVEPDTVVLDRSSRKIVEFKTGLQEVALRSAALEGTEQVALDEKTRSTPAVTQEQALTIADLAWQIEDVLKIPMDIEWAIDSRGRAFVVQVRPLVGISSRMGETRKPALAGAPVLLGSGTRVSGGAATGPVCRVESDLDILRFSSGSVVTTHEANPRLAVLLPKAVAVVADMGEVTGHLATVARELHIPAIFATRNATEILKPGETVTVDADAGVVYAGRVDAALSEMRRTAAPRNPNRELLRSVSGLITPLTLRDRLASGYAPRKCKTIHDIIRFCHQATIEAMFDLGDRTLRRSHSLRRLVSPVPIDCRIFDLGGGLNPQTDGEDVTLEEVVSRPMRALWRGMTDPRLRWSQARPVSLRGFMSAVVDYNFDLDARLRPMGEPSYAFVNSEYLNLNSRIGYHFSTIDARICDTIESNYASFRFVGGSTAIEQRSRRALLLQQLLAARGFETDVSADLVNARIRHRPAAEMDVALFEIGLLMGYVNHLDMALVSDQVMQSYIDAFLEGNYGYKS
jgi:pyruvate,water dikinase